MPVQTPQWTEFLACPVCQNEFQLRDRLPVSLPCGHTICTPCLDALQWNQCPLDQSKIGMAMHQLPVNTALLKLIGNGHIPERLRTTGELTSKEADVYRQCMKSLEALALYLKPQSSSQLSRPMQRKLVILVTSQLLNDEGRTKGVRAARSVGERCVLELILQHQNPFHLSTNLWAAVRARGCQFLGPAMQEDVLKLVLDALQDGTALSRKVLVMFVVQRLVKASKTSIGHVVQLLYRASCFKVTKRDGDSSLMQLKEELRNYEDLRKEHDTQIVQIAIEAGLRIGPDQWSSLLYGDYVHKSHMQSIIDKLQTPQSFSQSVQELLLALQKFGDPGNLSSLRGHFQVLTSIDPNIEPSEQAPSWPTTLTATRAAEAVTAGLISFSAMNGSRRTGETHNNGSKYKTSICRDFSQYGCCVRGPNCTFAHCTEELEFHRSNNNNPTTRNRFTDRSTTYTASGDARRQVTKLGSNEKGEGCQDLDDEEIPSMETINFPTGAPPMKIPSLTNNGKGLTISFNDHQVQKLPMVQRQSLVIPQPQQPAVPAGASQQQANKQQQQYAVIAAVQPQQAAAIRSATPQQMMAAVGAQQVVAVAATPQHQQQMQLQAASTQQLQAVAAAHQQMIGGTQLLGPGGSQDVMVINQAGASAQVHPSQVVAMQQPTNILGAADIAHIQAVAAVNHQIVVAQAALANNQQQAVAQQRIEQLQPQVVVAAANDQHQLLKMTNTQMGVGGQQQPTAGAVSRAHMEAAVAQGQMNIAHSLAQAAAAQSGMSAQPVLQVQQVPSGGGVMTIPTQRAMPLALHQQTQHTSVMAQIQMQNPTVSGQQQIAASKISNTAAGQLFTAADGSGQQHMMMVPTAGTQMSPIVDANGAPVIDIATGQQLLAAHTPVIAAPPPIQLADGTIVQNSTPVPVQSTELLQPVAVQATQLHPAGIPTLQPAPGFQDAIRRLSHDVSPEIASKSLQALEDRKEEIISELEDIVGPTAAKAIEDLTHKQAAQQKFGIGAVKQTSPAYEANLTNQQTGGVYGIWTSKPIATIASIFSSNSVKTSSQSGIKTTSSESKKLDGVEDEYSPLPEGICVSRFGPISRRLITTQGAPSVINSLPRSVSSTISADKTRTSDSGLTFPRASLQSDTNVSKSRYDDKVFEYNPGYYYDYIQGMDSVVMNHLTNPPLLPPSPMPPVRPVRDQFEVSHSEQNYSFLAESNRIQNELQELQRRLSCLSVAENSAQMVLKRDRLAFELRMVEGGIQERHKEINITTPTSDYN